MTPIIFGGKHKSWSFSECKFLKPPVAFLILSELNARTRAANLFCNVCGYNQYILFQNIISRCILSVWSHFVNTQNIWHLVSFEIITAVCLRNLFFWDKMLCRLVTCDVVKDNNSLIFTSLEILKTQPPPPPPPPPPPVLYCLHLLITSITFYPYQTWILFRK